jgi:hypothetical protein
VALQSVAWVQRCALPRTEHLLAFSELLDSLHQNGINWQLALRAFRFHRIHITVINPARDVEHITRKIRPLERERFANPQSSRCEKQDQRCIWLLEFPRNRVHLLGRQNCAGNSSSTRPLWQLHTTARIPLKPTAIGRPSQRKSQNDPHAAKSALAVLASFLRKEVFGYLHG